MKAISALLTLLALATLLGSVVQTSYAETGYFDSEIDNLTGSSLYRVTYSVPDQVLTNTTETANITFTILQIGGLTVAVKTGSIELELTANGRSITGTVAQEVNAFYAPARWGPFIFSFRVLDNDFGLNPGQEVTGHFAIAVFFEEIAAPFSTPYGHSVAKNDIAADLKSTTAPTNIDYLREALSAVEGAWPFASLVFVLTLAVSVSISIRIRRSIAF